MGEDCPPGGLTGLEGADLFLWGDNARSPIAVSSVFCCSVQAPASSNKDAPGLDGGAKPRPILFLGELVAADAPASWTE